MENQSLITTNDASNMHVNENNLIKENERVDDLQRNGYKLIQNTKIFCFGMDAVLLSGFAAVKAGEKVLDMGTGTGIIPLLLSAKTKFDVVLLLPFFHLFAMIIFIRKSIFFKGFGSYTIFPRPLL